MKKRLLEVTPTRSNTSINFLGAQNPLKVEMPTIMQDTLVTSTS